MPAPLESGWYAGDVLVTLAVGPDLSGVDKTYYSVDGGAAQEYAGPFNHSLKGVHTITFWSVDKAGNVEDKDAPGHSLTLKIDGVPPTITGSRAPEANGFGWNNGPVTVSFLCKDEESGIAGCTDPVTLANEGEAQFADGSALDNAGNSASARVEGINIDLTAPSLTGAPTTDANAAGWYKDDVAIHWTAVDGLSGIDPATAPARQRRSPARAPDLGAGPVSVSDKAGNSASASVSGIKIDRTAPVISGAPKTAPNAAGWYSGDVVVGFTCTDNLSGVRELPERQARQRQRRRPERHQRSGDRPRGQRERGQDGRRDQHRRPGSADRRGQPVHEDERLVHRQQRDGRPDGGRPERVSPASRRSTTSSTAVPSRSPPARARASASRSTAAARRRSGSSRSTTPTTGSP